MPARQVQCLDTVHGLVGMGGNLSQIGIGDRDTQQMRSRPKCVRDQARPTQGDHDAILHYKQHQFYCGIDLHARLLAICIVDQAGAVVLQTQIAADKQLLLSVWCRWPHQRQPQ